MFFFTLLFLVRLFIFEPFKISSGSMKPTLLVGDFIFVEKFSYRIKNPIKQKKLIKNFSPNLGDILVFKYPLYPKINYIKRVLGLPGDIIIYNKLNNQLKIYPGSKQNFATLLPINYRKLIYSDIIKNFNFTKNNKIINCIMHVYLTNTFFKNKSILLQNKKSLGMLVYKLFTISGYQNQLINYYQHKCCSIAKWIIPPKKYFMIGDHRDNSSDSRYWGLVPEKNIVGKAIAIWISFDNNQWTISIRFNRIGSIY